MTTLTPNGDDDRIAEFMQQFEAATDKSAVVREFAERHPHLAAAFADYAAGHSLMGQLGAGGEPASHLLKAGEMLGDFKVVRFVTHGGMGEIYEAEQIRLSKRRVALKVIRKGRSIPEARARFDREQAILAKLHQTNIVPVFANGERGDVQYFAMQYIDGATLGHVVKLLRTRDSRPGGSATTSTLAKLIERAVGPATEPMTEEPDGPPAVPALTDEYVRSVVESLAEVAEALHAAHEAGVVHRDVKPSNLMAEKSGKCWVIDFGLAGLVGEAATQTGTATDPADPALTATGSVMGTYAYMAPEQFGGHADRRTDVWALGVTLYELLALDRPFTGPLHDDYARQIRETEPIDLRTVSKAVPADLAAICAKAMRKAPAERYATAGAFAADLRHWLKHEPTTANPPWVWRRMAMWAHRQPGWASMVGVAVAAALAVVGLVLEVNEQKAKANERDAQAKVDAANKNTAFVEERAADAERQSQRQERLVKLHQAHLSALSDGWRERLWADGRQLAAESADPQLRDRMAALLGGLDAKLAFEHNDGPIASLSFDPTGRRLLFLGQDRNADRKQPLRARVLDLETRTVSGTSPGPVYGTAWRGTEAVQLVAPITRPTLELWEVGRERRLDEFAFPDGLRPDAEVIKVFAVLVAGTLGIPLPRLHGPVVHALAVSADGKHVAALVGKGKDTRSILVWKSGQQTPIATIPTGAADPVHFNQHIALSSDGSLAALAMDDGRVRVWTLADGPRAVATLNVGNSRITALTFARHRGLPEPGRLHPAGLPGWLLAAGDSGGELVVWDLGRLDRVMHGRDSHHEVFALAFSPDAVTLYSGGRHEVRAWDVATGRRLLTLKPGYAWITSLAVSPNEKQLAVGTDQPHRDGDPTMPIPAVKVYALEHGRGIDTLRGLTGQVCRLSVTSDATRVAAATLGYEIGVWDRSSGQLLIKATLPRAVVADHGDVRLSDDGRFLILVSGEEARRYELPGNPGGVGRQIDTWKLPPAFSNRLAITPDGTIVLCRTETRSRTVYPVAGVDRTRDPRQTVIVRLPPGQPAAEVRRHDDHPWHVFDIGAASDGSCFVVKGIASRDRGSSSIVGYDGPKGERLWRIPQPGTKGEGWAALDNSGRLLHYGNTKDGFWLRDLPSTIEDDSPAPAKLVIGLGRRYRFVDADLGVSVAHFNTDQPFLVLDPDKARGRTEPRFSPDGRWLIWGTEDGTVRVADLPLVRDQLVSAGFPGW